MNYYTRVYIKGDVLHPTAPTVLFRDPARLSEPVTDMGWTIYPRGLYEVLMQAKGRYGKPIFILENGTSDHEENDVGRQRYLTSHIREVWLAVHQGADVRGYFRRRCKGW